MIFDHGLDGSRGIKKTEESVKIIEDICLEQDLIDIWHVRNATEKRFTWRQKTPIIQRRLDYWLVNDSAGQHCFSRQNTIYSTNLSFVHERSDGNS